MPLSEHLEKLRHFYKLTLYRSINECAQAAGMSQGGLSKSIAGLESVLGTALFVRSNEGLILTKEGAFALEATKRILKEASDLELNLRSLRATHVPTRVRIGMYDSIAVYFFPDLMTYFEAIYPEVKVELVVDRSVNFPRLLEKGIIDLGIGVNLAAQRNQNTEFFLLFQDHYSFYSSPKAKEGPADAALILYPEAGDEHGVATERLLASLIAKRRVHRAHNFETIKALCVLGLGVGVLPTLVARPLVQQRLLESITIPRTSKLFGRHSIGFLASKTFLKGHGEFAKDLYRLGERWAKN
jgi:DNA-binding transcriptional LysR family regulator